jgi:hypothetical protein
VINEGDGRLRKLNIILSLENSRAWVGDGNGRCEVDGALDANEAYAGLAAGGNVASLYGHQNCCVVGGGGVGDRSAGLVVE